MYNDFKTPSLENIENMAREYTKALSKQGFVFVRLSDENSECDIIKQNIINEFVNSVNMVNKIIEFSNSNLRLKFQEVVNLLNEINNNLKDLKIEVPSISKVHSLGKIDNAINFVINNISKLSQNIFELKSSCEKNDSIDYCIKNCLKIIEIITN